MSIAAPTPPKIAGATHFLVEYWYTLKERANEVAAEINRDSTTEFCAEVWQDGAMVWDGAMVIGSNQSEEDNLLFGEVCRNPHRQAHPWTPKEQLRVEHACRDHQTEGKRLPSHTP
jgi:hypothetical protein